ncbi:MAG: cation transporter [Clostridia bacterium]|nr:cation transporter [Clostridia bacterium]
MLAGAENQNRDRIIVRTSVIGILANTFLAGFKAAVGLLSHSIAVVLDAVNNLSDATSSVITIIGVKLAGRDADKKHPFGYGRIEYLTALIISAIVLYAGATSFVESVRKIITPETPEYGPVALVIIAVGVAVKILLGRYVKGVGEKVNSDSLVNSGEDARLDAVISASTLVAAVIYMISGVSLEAWLGAIISLVIVKSGVGMLRDTLSRILGERADAELARAIKATVMACGGVEGVYDLVLNDYGPDTIHGSLHVEVPDTRTADELDELLRRIQNTVFAEHHVILTAIGIYSMNTRDENAIAARRRVGEIALSQQYVKQMHGFYINEAQKTIRFDLVVSFDAPNRRAAYNEAVAKVQAAYPGYQIIGAMDTDFSEI